MTIPSLELRRTPLEVFECRHCVTKTQSSDTEEIAAQLCKSCFDIRRQYRNDNRHKADERAEINWFGDPFGKERSGRKLICACCKKQYAVVPLDFHDPTEAEIEKDRAFFDKMAPIRERSGKSNLTFKVEVFDYLNAPKGWTNDILCKSCFDSLLQTFSTEIEQSLQEIRSKREYALARENAAIEEKELLAGITKEKLIGAIVFTIVLAASVVAFFKFISTGLTGGWNAASKESPFGKIVFYIFLGIAYLLSIPWLRNKGGTYRELSVVMSWIAGIAFSLFVISIIPSCNTERSLNSQDELPYYRK